MRENKSLGSHGELHVVSNERSANRLRNNTSAIPPNERAHMITGKFPNQEFPARLYYALMRIHRTHIIIHTISASSPEQQQQPWSQPKLHRQQRCLHPYAECGARKPCSRSANYLAHSFAKSTGCPYKLLGVLQPKGATATMLSTPSPTALSNFVCSPPDSKRLHLLSAHT